MYPQHPVLLKSVRKETNPFLWFDIPTTFATATATQLAATFPADGFTRVSRTDAAKSYSMSVRTLHQERDDGEVKIDPNIAALPPPWRAFLNQVSGMDYRHTIGRITGLDLAGARVEVNLWRYDRTSSLAPHVDKASKLVTHVMYLNPGWPTDGSGDLLLLGSAAAQDVVRRVPPRLGRSVLLVRSARSWHAVARAGHSVRADRCSAQVIFHRGGGA